MKGSSVNLCNTTLINLQGVTEYKNYSNCFIFLFEFLVTAKFNKLKCNVVILNDNLPDRICCS